MYRKEHFAIELFGRTGFSLSNETNFLVQVVKQNPLLQVDDASTVFPVCHFTRWPGKTVQIARGYLFWRQRTDSSYKEALTTLFSWKILSWLGLLDSVSFDTQEEKVSNLYRKRDISVSNHQCHSFPWNIEDLMDYSSKFVGYCWHMAVYSIWTRLECWICKAQYDNSEEQRLPVT